jgi:hypothetical protein
VRRVTLSNPARGLASFDDLARHQGPSGYPGTRDPETTLELMKALEHAAIVIEEPAPPLPPPAREPGYNPYNKEPVKPSRKT